MRDAASVQHTASVTDGFAAVHMRGRVLGAHTRASVRHVRERAVRSAHLCDMWGHVQMVRGTHMYGM